MTTVALRHSLIYKSQIYNLSHTESHPPCIARSQLPLPVVIFSFILSLSMELGLLVNAQEVFIPGWCFFFYLQVVARLGAVILLLN